MSADGALEQAARVGFCNGENPMTYEGHGKEDRILIHGDSGTLQPFHSIDPVAFIHPFHLPTFPIVAPVVCKLARNIPICPLTSKIILDEVNFKQLPETGIALSDRGLEIIDVFPTGGSWLPQPPGTNSRQDEPQVVSVPGQGTTVSTNQWKWKRNTARVIRLQ